VLFAVYVCWNLEWLARGKVPPSLLKFFLGLPCPTSGGLRSFALLIHGQWKESLYFNPFTVVYLALSVCSLAVLIRQSVRRERLELSPAIAKLWLGALLLGWLAKFTLGSRYW
jgi:hypothetical protein